MHVSLKAEMFPGRLNWSRPDSINDFENRERLEGIVARELPIFVSGENCFKKAPDSHMCDGMIEHPTTVSGEATVRSPYKLASVYSPRVG